MFWILCAGHLFHLDLHDLALAVEYFTFSPFTHVWNFGKGNFLFQYLKQNNYNAHWCNKKSNVMKL